MSHVIGIDLGTTNSCVAVSSSADIPNKDTLIATRRLREVNGALVIADKKGALTTPSVVWADRDGGVTVGRLAKQKASLLGVPPPAMFFKRDMGTTKQVTAGHRQMLPEQASAEVLKYLKGVAEEVLGEPVERAVVTVPAFFNMNAKQATTAAGELAGLEVVETLLEPVAAALMYTRSQELVRPMKIMAYDLGGGTFDASVVSWDPEVGFAMLAFEGDAFLGGYDFDFAVVRWMISQLPAYDLALKEDDADDAGVLASLLVLAEGAKQDLTGKLEVEIVSQRIEDRQGESMEIHLPLPVDTFEELIETRVEKTLESCDRVLAKAGTTPAELDEIIMVGGSSRVQLVERRLRDRYGRTPTIVNPDLCVAIGAALKAATAASTSSHLSLDRPMSLTSDITIDVSGRVLPGPQLVSVAGVRVELRADAGGLNRKATTNDDGRFMFDDIELEPDTENSFSVRVLVGDEAIDSQTLRITHAAGAGAGDLIGEGDVLANDMSVLIEGGGLHPVAKAGRALPYDTTVTLETANQRGELHVNLFDGTSGIGRVEVTDLPLDLPVGSPVHVDLVFERGWTIVAVARLPTAGPGASGRAVIDIPRVELPGWPELEARLAAVRADWHDMEGIAPPDEVFRVGQDLDAAIDRGAELVRTQHDASQTNHVIGGAEALLRSIRITDGRVLQPPMSEFEAALGELSALLERLEVKNAQSAGHHRAAMRALRVSGMGAHDAGNGLDWTTANESVDREIAAVREELGESPGAGGLPPTYILIPMLLEELDGIVILIDSIHEATGRQYTEKHRSLSAEASRIRSDIANVDTSSEERAAAEMVRLYHASINPLRAKVDKWRTDVQGGGDGMGPIDVRLPGQSITGGRGR